MLRQVWGQEWVRAAVDQRWVCSTGHARGSGTAGGSGFIGLPLPGARACVCVSAAQKVPPTPAPQATAPITGCSR